MVDNALEVSLFSQTRISLEYDVRKRIWTLEGDSPEPVVRQRHVKWTMMSLFWDIKGPILTCFTDEGVSVNGAIFRKQLETLRAKLSVRNVVCCKLLKSFLQKVRTGLLPQHPYFLMDNARPHTAHATAELVVKFKWRLVPQPAYSPGCAPSDYHVFRWLKRWLRGQVFSTLTGMKMAVNGWLKKQPRLFWREGIQKLPHEWRTIIEDAGEYRPTAKHKT